MINSSLLKTANPSAWNTLTIPSDYKIRLIKNLQPITFLTRCIYLRWWWCAQNIFVVLMRWIDRTDARIACMKTKYAASFNHVWLGSNLRFLLQSCSTVSDVVLGTQCKFNLTKSCFRGVIFIFGGQNSTWWNFMRTNFNKILNVVLKIVEFSFLFFKIKDLIRKLWSFIHKITILTSFWKSFTRKVRNVTLLRLALALVI